VSQSGVVFTDVATGNTGGNIEAIGGTVTLYLDPSALGFNIQNGYTYGENTAFRLWGFGSGFAGTGQFFSTLTVCQNPPSNPNEACIQTYNASGIGDPKGSLYTKAISTQSIQVSSINGLQIPGNLGLPVGSVTIWAGGSDNNINTQAFSVPIGWLICDGSFFLNSAYPALASVLGQKYGYPGRSPPPGQTALPDLTFAVPMGTPYRNYTNSIIPTIPSIELQATTSDSAYNTTSLTGGTQISSLTTWYITGKVGPVLNYGTLFPGNNVSIVGGGVTFPNMYISSIIQYEGGTNSTGYILLRSVDGTSPIPRVPGTSTITAIGQGSAGVIPDNPDTPYYLGTPNVEGRTQVTHNQKGIEVGQHQHQGVPNTTSSAIPGTGYSVGNGGYTNLNYQPYVSTPTFLSRNVGTYTAPNFLNMAYIIKA
jgi:microcystin-dependent protein